MADPRIDPRIKAVFGHRPVVEPSDVESREQVLAEANTEEAKTLREGWEQWLTTMDTEEIAPSRGLTIDTETVTSDPDGNEINIQIMRPDNKEVLPCVYYIHGGACRVCPASMAIFKPSAE